MQKLTSFESMFNLIHTTKRHMYESILQLGLPISPMHVRVMKIIDRKPHTTANDIACFINRDKAQVTRLLNLLIKESFIEKFSNPDDKRSQYLGLTTQGKAVIVKLIALEDRMQQQLVNGVTDAELAQLTAVLDKMNLNAKQL